MQWLVPQLPIQPRTLNCPPCPHCQHRGLGLSPCPILGLAAGVMEREKMQPFKHVHRANQLSGDGLHVASTRSSSNWEREEEKEKTAPFTKGRSQRSWSLRSWQVQGSWQKCSPPRDASSFTFGGAHGAGPGWASDETQVLSPAQQVKWSLVLLPLSLCCSGAWCSRARKLQNNYKIFSNYLCVQWAWIVNLL